MLEERHFETLQTLSSLNLCPLILTFPGGSTMQQCLLLCSNGDFIIPSFLINLLIRIPLQGKHMPSWHFIYLFNHLFLQYRFMNMYFIPWVIIQYYLYLFCYWNCCSFHDQELYKVGSYVLVNAHFYLSSFFFFFFYFLEPWNFFYFPHPSSGINHFSK